MKELAVAMIKPDGMEKNLASLIEEVFIDNRLQIITTKTMTLTRVQAELLTGELRDPHLLPLIIEYLTSGESKLIILEGEDAIRKVREIIGVTKLGDREASGLRKLYAENYLHNVMHGAVNEHEVLSNLEVLMPEFLTNRKKEKC